MTARATEKISAGSRPRLRIVRPKTTGAAATKTTARQFTLAFSCPLSALSARKRIPTPSIDRMAHKASGKNPGPISAGSPMSSVSSVFAPNNRPNARNSRPALTSSDLKFGNTAPSPNLAA
jgi:hypothetical protein